MTAPFPATSFVENNTPRAIKRECANDAVRFLQINKRFKTIVVGILHKLTFILNKRLIKDRY